MDIDNPSNFAERYFDKNGDDAEDEFILLNIEKNTSAIEINIEIILHLFLNVLLIIHFKNH